jgi:hypothetical protein
MPARLDCPAGRSDNGPPPLSATAFRLLLLICSALRSLSLPFLQFALCCLSLYRAPAAAPFRFRVSLPFPVSALALVNYRLFRTLWLRPGAWLALPDAPWFSVLPAHCGVEPASALCRPAPPWVTTVPACLAYLASPARWHRASSFRKPPWRAGLASRRAHSASRWVIPLGGLANPQLAC